VIDFIRKSLAHPRTRRLGLDDPRTTVARRVIVREKPFLRRVYADWYTKLVATLPHNPGWVLELGSGAGFLREFIPRQLIASERIQCSGVDVILDGQRLPFADNSLRAIVMTDVLHHLPQVRAFLSEAQRCVKPAGVVSMIEPWVTRWSRIIYGRLHHEPFLPEAASWEFPAKGPLSGANGALPWIVFFRDRPEFETEFPGLCIETITPLMPFRYLVSGGVSLRNLMPLWAYPALEYGESMLAKRMNHWAMFAMIVLRRV
jgi:SAM-dependent methyltransferase